MNYETESFEDLNYVLRTPDNFEAGKKYPVILLMHGAGGRGNDIESLKTNPYFKVTDKYDDFPFVSVAPQCSKNTWFDHFQTLEAFIKFICAREWADTERIYIMGASMGGYAAWQLAMSMPEIFAAAVPICGGGMYWNSERLKNMPVWAFHGEDDPVVFAGESKNMVEKINAFGGNARLTIYPNTGHNAWEATYGNPEVFEWLLSNRNKNKIPEGHEWDAEIYG